MPAPAFFSGATVVVTAALPNDPILGTPLNCSDISYTLTDENGDTLATVDLGAVEASAGQVQARIEGSLNEVSGVSTLEMESGAFYSPSRALRQVNFVFTTASGTFFNTQSYIVNASQPLTRMDNTFITWPESVLVRYEMPPLPGWDAATPDQQIAALITAYNAMLTMRYRFPIGENWQSRIVDFYGMSTDNVFGRIFMVLADIGFYTQEDYNGWPYPFQQALKRGQMAQADFILGGDPIGSKRQDGILSETIGESNMRFRNISDVVLPVCPAALRELRGFLNNTVLVGRG